MMSDHPIASSILYKNFTNTTFVLRKSYGLGPSALSYTRTAPGQVRLYSHPIPSASSVTACLSYPLLQFYSVYLKPHRIMTQSSLLNGVSANGTAHVSQDRVQELDTLLRITLKKILSLVQAADNESFAHEAKAELSTSCLIDYRPPSELRNILSDILTLADSPSGVEGFQTTLDALLKYSVNTSAPGFLDKLYAAPVPPGIAADLILSILNTNVHVYQVSPVLTLIEKHVTKALASMFGLDGPRAGGINVQGGSASNMTSIVNARNTLFPRTKVHGNSVDGLDLVLFTSAHGHYSIEKAAQQCGFGSAAVVAVPVDPANGQMVPAELERLIVVTKGEGKTPFYVNATAGTTVLGSFDPFVEISAVAKKYGLWMHIDGAWGGSFVFSQRLRQAKLRGSELADSIAINPHKMMGVPVTCSFLLGKDMKQFHEANTLKAGYLFHDNEEEEKEDDGEVNGHAVDKIEDSWQEPNNLADMTLQCGRRGDSLKLFMAWQYYGTDGYRSKIERAHEVACQMAKLLSAKEDFILVSENPPPCLQVCFYYAPSGKELFGDASGQVQPASVKSDTQKLASLSKLNSKVTERITKALVQRGFMIDFAPALEGQERRGKFFRAVVNISSPVETVQRLVREIEQLGPKIADELRIQYS